MRQLLKPHAELLGAALRASDPAILIAVGFVAYRAYLGAWLPPEHYLFFLAASALWVLATFPSFRLYEPQRGASLANELRQLLLAWAAWSGAFAGAAGAQTETAASSEPATQTAQQPDPTFYQQRIQSTTEQFGKNSLQTAEAYSDLADSQRRAGQHEQATQSYVTAVEIYRSIDGPFTNSIAR